MGKKYRRVAILAKAEVTYGTDPVPTGAANAMVVSDFEITPLDGEEVERNNLQPSFGNFSVIQATQFARIKFNVELAGSGAAGTAPKWGPLARACAVSETVSAGVSVTYAPISTVVDSVSIYCNIDGKNQVMPGTRGECRLVMDAKGKPMLQFEFMGLWATPTDTALPTVSYTGWVTPVAMNKVNTTVTLHAIAVACSHFDLAFGNQLVKRDLTAIDTVEIIDRKSQGSIKFEDTTVAVKNWIQVAKDKTLGNLQVVHGVTAGNIVTVNATGTCQLGKPSYENEDGQVMVNAPLRFQPTAAGNDEWSVVCT